MLQLALAVGLPGLTSASGTSASAVPLAHDRAGTFAGGGAWRFKVPRQWNGTLLVFAHGYRDLADHPGEVEDRAAYTTLSSRESPQLPDMEEELLARGFALAGSAYPHNGWAVAGGAVDTASLRRLVAKAAGEPHRTVAVGASMGALVALKAAGLRGARVDGVLALCGPTAGATLVWDEVLDIAIAFDVAFGWPAAWGTPHDVRDDLDFESEVVPVLLALLQDPANLPRFELLRLLSNRLPDGYYDGRAPAPWLFLTLYFATEGRAELERRAGGPFTQNLDHAYGLSAAARGYLGSLGVDGAAAVDSMGSPDHRFGADAAAREYLRRNYDQEGQLGRLVLTLHSTTDGLVVPSHAEALARLASKSDAQRQLLSLFVGTDTAGHCNFTVRQVAEAVSALDRWVRTRRRPAPASLPESAGFLRAYQPAPWPQPIP